jgi:hypothetical protein
MDLWMYPLSTVHFSLSTCPFTLSTCPSAVGCPLSTGGFSPFTVRSTCTFHFSLSTFHYPLFLSTFQYPPFTVHLSMSTFQYPPFTPRSELLQDAHMEYREMLFIYAPYTPCRYRHRCRFSVTAPHIHLGMIPEQAMMLRPRTCTHILAHRRDVCTECKSLCTEHVRVYVHRCCAYSVHISWYLHSSIPYLAACQFSVCRFGATHGARKRHRTRTRHKDD